MPQPTSALVLYRLRDSVVRFRDDESGTMSFFFLLMFVLMITFGGIAIDVMRFETRRVAMQQTLDRAALAAASLTQTRTPQQVVDDYFAKANLDDGQFWVNFDDPTVVAQTDAGLRRVFASAEVTSKNFFMGIFTPVDTLSGVSATRAEQGVSQIEVMLVLDVTGSMGDPAGDGKSKIESMITAANSFVDIVKSNDKKDGVSIGVVPYAAQVNIPPELRQQFQVLNLSAWDGIGGQGVPNINCFEFPTSSYSTTGISLTDPIQMAAVADARSGTTTNGNIVNPQGPGTHSRACTTNDETNTTAWNDTLVNHVLLPTKNAAAVKEKISRLTANGNTYIAVGMRWATALLDQSARPIYDELRKTEPGMAGRPADNDSIYTRKIIVLMTDGEHVENYHIVDAFKTGPSPIWRTANNRYAIRYSPNGPALTGGTRPGGAADNTCSGWQLTNYANRQFFVPGLKRNEVREKLPADVNEIGNGNLVAGACDPRSWIAQELDGLGQPILRLPRYNNAGAITAYDVATPLDWSEVWRYVRVSWVAQQLYARSGTGVTYDQAIGQFRAIYLDSRSNLNSLLQANCTAAKAAGIEVYGIAFAAPTNGQNQIKGCASELKDDYYFQPTSGDDIAQVFQQIATRIQDLRLTQ